MALVSGAVEICRQGRTRPAVARRKIAGRQRRARSVASTLLRCRSVVTRGVSSAHVTAKCKARFMVCSRSPASGSGGGQQPAQNRPPAARPSKGGMRRLAQCGAYARRCSAATTESKPSGRSRHRTGARVRDADAARGAERGARSPRVASHIADTRVCKSASCAACAPEHGERRLARGPDIRASSSLPAARRRRAPCCARATGCRARILGDAGAT